jgi:hypothetical protein
MKTFIVPDIHGHYKTLKALLKEAGVIDHQGDRVDGWEVISLGDLANCVATDVQNDVNCLKTVGTWIDTLLIGNHEHPYFGGPAFGGFERYPDVERQLNRIEREGRLAPAMLVGPEDDILLTHAGYVPSEGIESALDGFNYATEKWQEDKTHPLFSQIGASRGGFARYGGIIWSDWNMEPKAEEFNQIVGHTPQREGVSRRDYDDGHWSLCIDIGAKSGTGATGIVIDENGELEFVSTPMTGNYVFNPTTGKWE